MKARMITAGIALLLAASSPALCAAQGAHPHARQGWLVGLGLGGGSVGFSANGSTSDRTGGGAGNLRVGYAFQPQLSLDLSSIAWTKSENGATLTVDVVTAELGYYPQALPGLVLRGGVGSGTGDLTLSFGNTSISSTTSGFGFNLGTGYEFRVARTFAIGPSVDFGWTSLSDVDANFINFGIAGTWYFIPRG